jgi:hypothetical protein
MASHDYYNQFNGQDTSYASGGRSNHQDTSYPAGGRTNQPLPPIPSSPSTRPHQPYVDTSRISPVQSPFHDEAYPAYPPPSQSHSHMPDYADRPSYSHDPFRDSNAIPLQSGQGLKPGAYASTSPTSAMGEAEQQYPPRRGDKHRRSRTKKKQGWFTGKITWAVFFLSTVQFIVFVVEIVRNGLFSLFSL